MLEINATLKGIDTSTRNANITKLTTELLSPLQSEDATNEITGIAAEVELSEEGVTSTSIAPDPQQTTIAVTTTPEHVASEQSTSSTEPISETAAATKRPPKRKSMVHVAKSKPSSVKSKPSSAKSKVHADNPNELVSEPKGQNDKSRLFAGKPKKKNPGKSRALASGKPEPTPSRQQHPKALQATKPVAYKLAATQQVGYRPVSPAPKPVAPKQKAPKGVAARVRAAKPLATRALAARAAAAKANAAKAGAAKAGAAKAGAAKAGAAKAGAAKAVAAKAFEPEPALPAADVLAPEPEPEMPKQAPTESVLNNRGRKTVATVRITAPILVLPPKTKVVSATTTEEPLAETTTMEEPWVSTTFGEGGELLSETTMQTSPCPEDSQELTSAAALGEETTPSLDESVGLDESGEECE